MHLFTRWTGASPNAPKVVFFFLINWYSGHRQLLSGYDKWKFIQSQTHTHASTTSSTCVYAPMCLCLIVNIEFTAYVMVCFCVRGICNTHVKPNLTTIAEFWMNFCAKLITIIFNHSVACRLKLGHFDCGCCYFHYCEKFSDMGMCRCVCV